MVLVELLECLVVVTGVVDETVVGKDDALWSAKTSRIVDVAFLPGASVRLGKQAIVVVEDAAADAHAGTDVTEVALGGDPSRPARLGLGDVIRGQMPIGVDVERHLGLARVSAVFGHVDGDIRLRRRGLWAAARLVACHRATHDAKADRGDEGEREGRAEYVSQLFVHGHILAQATIGQKMRVRSLPMVFLVLAAGEGMPASSSNERNHSSLVR